MSEIKEIINCQPPTLEVGKKYTFNIYDMHLYEGYTVSHELVDIRYIFYEGGDIANYLMQIGRRYSFDEFKFVEKLGDRGECICEIRNARGTDDHYHADLIFEMHTTGDNMTRISLALHIHKHNEPIFMVL
jgi:hypothetical protein